MIHITARKTDPRAQSFSPFMAEFTTVAPYWPARQNQFQRTHFLNKLPYLSPPLFLPNSPAHHQNFPDLCRISLNEGAKSDTPTGTRQPDTIPLVTVCPTPKGLPMAMTKSPILMIEFANCKKGKHQPFL